MGVIQVTNNTSNHENKRLTDADRELIKSEMWNCEVAEDLAGAYRANGLHHKLKTGFDHAPELSRAEFDEIARDFMTHGTKWEVDDTTNQHCRQIDIGTQRRFAATYSIPPLLLMNSASDDAWGQLVGHESERFVAPILMLFGHEDPVMAGFQAHIIVHLIQNYLSLEVVLGGKFR